jgi:hypothetical protein
LWVFVCSKNCSVAFLKKIPKYVLFIIIDFSTFYQFNKEYFLPFDPILLLLNLLQILSGKKNIIILVNKNLSVIISAFFIFSSYSHMALASGQNLSHSLISNLFALSLSIRQTLFSSTLRTLYRSFILQLQIVFMRKCQSSLTRSSAPCLSKSLLQMDMLAVYDTPILCTRLICR